MAAAPKGTARFFEDDDLNFVFLIVLGGAYDLPHADLHTVV